jgi:hypothetical protein
LYREPLERIDDRGSPCDCYSIRATRRSEQSATNENSPDHASAVGESRAHRRHRRLSLARSARMSRMRRRGDAVDHRRVEPRRPTSSELQTSASTRQRSRISAAVSRRRLAAASHVSGATLRLRHSRWLDQPCSPVPQRRCRIDVRCSSGRHDAQALAGPPACQ